MQNVTRAVIAYDEADRSAAERATTARLAAAARRLMVAAMARPQSPDYDKRREAILAAAAQLYARQRLSRARRSPTSPRPASTSKSLIYHYFPSKDDILYAVMASISMPWSRRPRRRREAAARRSELRALTLAFMRLYVGAQDRHKVLLNELDNLAAGARAPRWSPSSGGSSPRSRSWSARLRPGARRAGAAAHDAVLRHDQLDPHLVRCRAARSCRRRWRCWRSRSDAGRA